ncbi:MAG: HAMP domain-containing sensor histidine kinase [Cyanobacteriota bacterium]|nr:HAMP domain-containing sensor histidine kinase [Cyanobacteriota bacterium]
MTLEPLLAATGGVGLGLLIARAGGQRRQRRQGVQRAQLLRWLEAAPTGWLILDPDDRISLVNGRAERLLDSPGLGLRHPLWLTDLPRGGRLVEALASARRLQRSQRLDWQPGEEELEVLLLPGEEGWLALILQPRRSLEAQLEHQERWVSDVAHELRTPLTALLLVGDSLAARADSGNAVLVERLQRELRRLQEMVGDLLELSRLQNTLPEAAERRRPVPVGALVEQVWAGLRPLAEQRRIQLQLRLATADGELVVTADPSRLHRALLNLLDNALRFSPEAAVVEVELRRAGGWGLISVRDHGAGLSENDLEHLFERFYRGDPARGRGGRSGSGLGLAIVQQIALTHGGRVQAGNHPGGGALLELVLPVGP